MHFFEFLQLQDEQLANQLIVEHLVVPGEISLGPIKIGQSMADLRDWPLDWDSGYENQIEFRQQPEAMLRHQELELFYDDQEIVRFARWSVYYNVPPNSDLCNPELSLSPAFESSLGKPAKSNKAGRAWRVNETLLMLSHGNEDEYNGVVNAAVGHEPFLDNVCLHPTQRKLR